MSQALGMKELVLLLSAALTGCAPALPPAPPAPMPPQAPAPAGVHLTVEPPIAPAGSIVTLVLHNATGGQVGYNLCSSRLEQLQVGGWRVVPDDRVCTAHLAMLAPGQEARYQQRLPSRLPAGQYRFSTRVEAPMNTSPQGLLVSAPFEVRP